MVRRSARAAGIATKWQPRLSTMYFSNGGMLENVAMMAGRASTRTIPLYDGRSEAITLTEVPRARL